MCTYVVNLFTRRAVTFFESYYVSTEINIFYYVLRVNKRKIVYDNNDDINTAHSSYGKTTLLQNIYIMWLGL